MKKSDASQGQSASGLIPKRIADLDGWRGETLGDELKCTLAPVSKTAHATLDWRQM
ncbi:MAG: hypothetical protein WB784_10730 [Rhodanobacteraceae bacterium]